MSPDIEAYNEKQKSPYSDICQLIAAEIDYSLSEAKNKIWHAHPVWFIDDNPIVGYSLQRLGIRLMFWSGADFEEPLLNVLGTKFKDASIFFNNVSDVNINDLQRWLEKSKTIQWDYKNLIKRKGKLKRLI
ncbi:MAG: DUF1801 domain-containing protein [Candidatus Kapaibacterium sp.]